MLTPERNNLSEAVRALERAVLCLRNAALSEGVMAEVSITRIVGTLQSQVHQIRVINDMLGEEEKET